MDTMDKMNRVAAQTLVATSRTLDDNNVEQDKHWTKCHTTYIKFYAVYITYISILSADHVRACNNKKTAIKLF